MSTPKSDTRGDGAGVLGGGGGGVRIISGGLPGKRERSSPVRQCGRNFLRLGSFRFMIEEERFGLQRINYM